MKILKPLHTLALMSLGLLMQFSLVKNAIKKVYHQLKLHKNVNRIKTKFNTKKVQDLCIVIRKSAMSLVFYIHNYVHNSHPKLIRANKVLTCSKNCQYKSKFTILDLTSLKLPDFHDASFGNLPHGWSQGFIIFFVDRKGNDPLRWASKRIKRIVKSMLVTEILPLAENTFLLANFIEELMPHKKN